MIEESLLDITNEHKKNKKVSTKDSVRHPTMIRMMDLRVDCMSERTLLCRGFATARYRRWANTMCSQPALSLNSLIDKSTFRRTTVRITVRPTLDGSNIHDLRYKWLSSKKQSQMACAMNIAFTGDFRKLLWL